MANEAVAAASVSPSGSFSAAMSVGAVLGAFATIFAAELPDKSMFATIVLVTRYRRPGWVWLGATAAFAVHVVVAVAAGRALSLLPGVAVKTVVVALFAGGAVVLFRAGRRAEVDAADDGSGGASEPDRRPPSPLASPWSTVSGSFGLIVVAEWGDLTQLATASLAARSGQPLATGIGALVALAAVAALAATLGRQLVARVSLHLVNYVGAAVFAGLAVWTCVALVEMA